MELNELKEQISARTGIPAILLTGDSEQSVLDYARKLLDYKTEDEPEKKRSLSEQFVDWFKGVSGHEDPEPSDPLSDIAEQVRIDTGGYPVIPDSSTVTIKGHKSASEELADFIKEKSTFDPFKHGGWKRIK